MTLVMSSWLLSALTRADIQICRSMAAKQLLAATHEAANRKHKQRAAAVVKMSVMQVEPAAQMSTAVPGCKVLTEQEQRQVADLVREAVGHQHANAIDNVRDARRPQRLPVLQAPSGMP